MTETLKTVEGISSIDRESIKPGEIRIDDNPREWKPLGIGRGKDSNHLLVLEKIIDRGIEEELRAVLDEHPDYVGKLLVDVGASLEEDERGSLVVKLLEDKSGIWRVLKSDCWMEAYHCGNSYDVTIRTLAYEKVRLLPIMKAFPELYRGIGN